MIINKFGIREQNEAMVLKTIISNNNISRVEISNKTHLNKASVSQIAQALIDRQLVLETGSGQGSTSGGRKPIQLCFNGQAGLAIAFDIGYNYLNGQMTYLDGSIIHFISKKDLFITATNAINTIKDMMTEFVTLFPETPHGLTGIALAIHGVVNQGTMTMTPYYDLAAQDLVTPLEQLYDVPVFIENEANLTALGEFCFSSLEKNLISLSIHSGIGAGIILNGSLITGKHGFAGEIGHTTLFPNGKPCPCGNQGCIEQYASNKVLFDSYADQKQLPYVNSDMFAQAYTAGDELAQTIAHENADYLSIGLKNLVVHYDPETIIINSSVYRKIPSLVAHLEAALTNIFTKELSIKNSQLAEQAPLYGGIAVVIMNFLSIPDLKFYTEK